MLIELRDKPEPDYSLATNLERMYGGHHHGKSENLDRYKKAEELARVVSNMGVTTEQAAQALHGVGQAAIGTVEDWRLDTAPQFDGADDRLSAQNIRDIYGVKFK
jgi:hypothetical protein